MRENKRHLFWTETILSTLKHWVTGKLDTLNRKIATIIVPVQFLMSQRSSQAMKVSSSFLAINLDRDMLE